jgi:hypothetical protein
MGLIKINDNPSTRELRQFAGIWFPLLWVVVAVLVYMSTQSTITSAVLVVLGATAGAVGYVKPAFIHPIYLLWMYAAFPIGWTLSHVVLLVIFYGIFTPVAFVMRLVGYDPMHRRLAGGRSDWVRIAPTTDKTEYFRQF